MRLLLTDVRFALRLLVRSPGFAATVLLLLSVGLAAVTAMFSVAEHLVLRPLPFHDAEEITALWVRRPDSPGRSPASYADFLDWKDRGTSFQHLAALHSSSYTFGAAGTAPEAVEAARVTAGFFEVFGIAPSRGRLLEPDDDRPDAPPVVVVSHRFWKERLAGDPDLVGRAVTLNGRAVTVVGVAPPGFRYGGTWASGAEMWVPFAMWTKNLLAQRTLRDDGHYLQVIGRRRSGVSLAAAQAQMDGIARDLEVEYPRTNANAGVNVVDLREALTGPLRERIGIVLAAVFLVFVAICANVSGLLLTRSAARRAEMAARAALGATTSRLVAQALTETAVLFVLGGLGGLVLSRVTIELLIPDLLTSSAAALVPIQVDVRAFAFGLAAAVVCGIACGVAPALTFARVQPQAVLKLTSVAAGMTRRQRRLGGAFVAAQLAVAVALLTGATLTGRATLRASSVPPGFDSERLATATLQAVGEPYREADAARPFQLKVMAAIAAHPGVESVAMTRSLPMYNHSDAFFRVEGRQPVPTGTGPVLVDNIVSPEFFATMGIPLRRGRLFTPADDEHAARVMVIAESVAARIFPGEDPIGKRIGFLWNSSKGEPEWAEVVGIVANIRRYGLTNEPALDTYLPYDQMPANRWVAFLARTSRPRDVAAAIPQIVRSVDPTQAVTSHDPMTTIVASTIASLRDVAYLLAAFAAIGLLLAMMGLFGLASYTTNQRRREIGLRMALGATPGRILSLLLGDGGKLVAIGLGAGALGATVVGRLLAARFPDVTAIDAAPSAAIAAALGLVALLAVLVPAWRATRTAPGIALKHD